MVVVNVRSYKRRSKLGKIINVNKHKKRYPVPRGKRGKLRKIPSKRTRWLKDSEGLFVGRSSSARITPLTIRPVVKSRFDNTTALMESNYGRHLGRS